METILYTSVSVNGRVLLAENPNHQVPQEVLGDFMDMAKKVGNLVLGRKTFNLMLQHPAAKQAFSGVELVVLSHRSSIEAGYKVVASPEQAISYLESMGFDKVFIGGGTHTYNSFLKGGLVTEMYLNMVPIVSESGGMIGEGEKLLINLKLARHKLINEEVMQLHYVQVK